MQPQENFMRKYYTEQAWSERTRLRDQWNEMPGEAREKWGQEWKQLFTEIETDIDRDPASEAAQALTKRWLQLVDRGSGGNNGIRTGAIEAWKDRLNWPQAEQDTLLTTFGLDPQNRVASMQRLEAVANFIGRAIGLKVQTSLRSLYGLDQPSSN
jgi:hypothetical protein